MNINGLNGINFSSTTMRFTGLFVVLVLLQVLIFNHILLFGVAVPLIFIYFIISLPIGINLNLLYTLSFLIGFIVDVFSDTMGLNSLSCILMSVVKTPVFYAYIPRDDESRFMYPSIRSMGWMNYSKYLISMTAIYCLLLFVIEYLSFASFGLILLMFAGSTILSFFLMLAVESIFMAGIEKR